MVEHDNVGNAAIAILSGMPAYFAVIDPTTITLLSAIVLPCIFFAIGKGCDLALKYYIETRKR